MFRFCPVLLFFVINTSYSQSTIDSLRERLIHAHLKKDQEAIFISQSHLGWNYYKEGVYDSARSYYWSAISNPKKTPALHASNLNTMGIICGVIGLPDSSIYYYGEALSYYESQKDTIRMVQLENNLSIIYKNKGQYEAALEYGFSILHKIEHWPPDRTLASTYNTIGSVYYNLKDYSNCLKYYQQALRTRKGIGYLRGVGQSYNNIGEVYGQMHRYDSALTYHLQALEVKQEIKDYAGVTLSNIGYILLQMGNAMGAKPYLEEALGLSVGVHDIQGEVMVLNHLGDVSLQLHDYPKAKAYLTRAGAVADKIKGLEYTKKNLELKIQLYQHLGDYKAAFTYTQRLLQVKDSLLNEEISDNLSRLQVVYETEKKEQQIVLLNQEKEVSAARLEINRIWIYTLVGGIGLVLIILFLVFRQFQMTQRNKKHVEVLLDELHHRVKNNLQILSSIITLQAEQLTDENAQLALRNSEARINAMSLIHRQLYTKGRRREINLHEFVTELVAYLSRSNGFEENSLQVDLQIDAQLNIDIDKAIPIGLVLNELMTNAFKYAFSGISSPQLAIAGKINDTSVLVLTIRDNGVGIQTEQHDQEGGFGIKMVKILLKELKGELSLNSDHGTIIVLTIPLTVTWKVQVF